jgi:NAD(P)H-dependent FMN reductase
MKKLKIAVLIGTTRKKRQSIHAARFVAEVGKSFNEVEINLVDPNDFDFKGDGNDPEGKDPKYTRITEEADGFFIVTPEYNHSFPGSLKRMLDSELKNYIHKPVAFASTSSGRWGGIRAIEALILTVREMGMVATFSDMQFPKVQDIFSKDGSIKDKSYSDYTKSSWEELIWMTKVLKYGKENIQSKYHN